MENDGSLEDYHWSKKRLKMATLIPSHSRQGSNIPMEEMQNTAPQCSHCAARLLELKRQAIIAMMMENRRSAINKSGVTSSGHLFIAVYEQLRLPDNFRNGLQREQCEYCSTHVEILKREAVLCLHLFAGTVFPSKHPFLTAKMMPDQGPFSHSSKGHISQSSGGEKHDVSEARKSTVMASSKMNETARENITVKRHNQHHNEQQQSETPSAAIFFAKAAQKFNIPAKKKTKKSGSQCQNQKHDYENEEKDLFPTNFNRCLNCNPPANPPGLFKYMGRRVDGKVKIMLRIAASPSDNGSSVPFLRVDQRRKQVTLPEPSNSTDVSSKSLTPTAPKLFAFDAIFESSASKTEICSAALLDVLHAVINGGDGCLIVYGANGLGKTDSMIGKHDNPQSLGLIPCAISWLYNLIEDSKQRTGARFSVRVSGVEIVGRSENLKDLLAEQASGGSSTSSNGTSPGIYLREDPVGGVQLSNLKELRAATSDKASFFLDAALAARTNVPVNCKESLDITEHQGSHMIFTLHVYQYRIDKTGRGGVHGGRSRLHLIDLSAWPRNAFKDGLLHSAPTQVALGKIILSMLNGTKQVPYKDSKIARLLKDSIGNPTCRTTIINHVSPDEDYYSETLATLEMASKISRSRRRKNKYCSASSSGGDSSCDEAGRMSRRLPRPPAVKTYGIDVAPKIEPNVSDYTSSAGEDSCDTVIYVGPQGRISDQDLTDNESPPKDGRLSGSDFLLSDCDNVDRPSSPKFGPRSLSNSRSQSSDSKLTFNERVKLSSIPQFESKSKRPSTPPQFRSQDMTPPRASAPAGVEAFKGGFLMSDCDDEMDGRSSPRFGPKISTKSKDMTIETKESLNPETEFSQADLSEKEPAIVEEPVNEIDIPCLEDIEDEISNVIGEVDNKNGETNSASDVIEVFVEDNTLQRESAEKPDPVSNVNENEITEENNANDDIKRKFISEIISKTRPNIDYFKHEPDEDEYSYLNMGPVTEKELRKSERRIKKLLKGGLIDLSHIHCRDRSATETSYMSDCEADTSRHSSENSKRDLNGYSSAPETENRRWRLQKIFTRTLDSVDQMTDTQTKFDSGPSTCASTSVKRLSAEETRSLLKEYVSKKLEERNSSPETVEARTKQGDDLIDKDESFVPSSLAEIKYVPTATACITSTRRCRGSFSSIQSSEVNSVSPLPSDKASSLDTSYDKAETISMASCAGSEDAASTLPGSPCCDGTRRRRSPIKIHYRWSTVFEEDEKSKISKNERPNDTQSKSEPTKNESKKKNKDKKNDNDSKTFLGKSPKLKSKLGGKSPKLDSKNVNKLKKAEPSINDASPKTSQKNEANRLQSPGVRHSSHSVSECSDLSESSGIASTDNSSLSQQSIQGSPIASITDDLVCPAQSSISPRARKWFFSRRSRSSGYVSDGNITDSSRASSRSRRFFGSKSKLSTGHSSGYESMRTDGGMSNASGAESACELDGSGRRKKKRFLGFRRRSTSDLTKKGRSKRSYWIDNPESDEERVEYKVYQIEDIEDRLASPLSPKSEHSGRTLLQNAKLLESHRKRVMELNSQKSQLETELDKAMNRLMMKKEQYKVKGSKNMDPDHPQYANELEREVGLFQRRLRVLKAHLEIITCFDKKKSQKTTSI